MYEYKVMTYFLGEIGDYDEINASMNKMAKDGWKVNSVVSHALKQVIVFYERKIK